MTQTYSLTPFTVSRADCVPRVMYQCTDVTATDTFTKTLCDGTEDIVMDGVDLTANYAELFPFPGALPAQVYTFEITASVTDGQSIPATFTWTLSDPCLEDVLTLIIPTPTFTDDYSGTT